MECVRFRYTWRESWCNCVRKTLYLIFTLLAIVEMHLQPFPHHGLSCDHVVRHLRTTDELCDFHSQSQGMCWYFIRTALETLSTQIGGEWSASGAKRDYCWTFWSQNLTVDLRRIYLTTRDLTSWSQPYRDDKCTKQLYSVWILPVNYKWIMNRHARRIDLRVDSWQAK